MTIFEISAKVKQLHLSNKDAAANYIANDKGDIIQVVNIDDYVSTDCYCFICSKSKEGEVLLKLA